MNPRRGFLGWLVASAAALVLSPRHVQASRPRDVLPDLSPLHEAPGKKLYFSVQLAADGSFVWRRVHIGG